MMQIKSATTSSQFKTIEKLAYEIMHEVYAPEMPKAHIDYFLETLQTVKAIKKQIANEGYEYYLIEHGGEDVAYLGLQHKDSILHISKFYVLPTFRSAGIGTHAMELVKKRAKELEVSKMELLVNRRNSRGIKFYERHGFKIEKAVESCFDNGHCEEDFLMGMNGE